MKKMETNEIIDKVTIMMQQYLTTKQQYEDTILFYRLGDFYEFFFDDAILVSKLLDLTLTGKDCGLKERAPMCGIPYHAAEGYIAKLVSLGYKVAICEQMESFSNNKKSGKKLVDREVVRIITPGTLIDENMLEDKRNNYIACIYEHKKEFAITYCDLSTGEFETCNLGGEYATKNLNDILVRIMPSEVLCNESLSVENNLPICKLNFIAKFSRFNDNLFDYTRCNEILAQQFGEGYIKRFGVKEGSCVQSSGVLIKYLFDTQKRSLCHINNIKICNNAKYMTIDINTRRNLEILETMKDRRKRGSLIGLLDKTKTPMGARMLRSWVEQPLNDAKEINARLDCVEEFYSKIMLRDSFNDLLSYINDIERISGRIAYGTNFSPKDSIALKKSLSILPKIKKLLENTKVNKLKKIYNEIPDFSDIIELLDRAINEDCPLLISGGNVIKQGYNQELDTYRSATIQGKSWVADLEQKERERTGIKNLKINYNRVFGYFIEVNKSLAANVPLDYIRKQTVANNERYITEELKVIEETLLNAEEKSLKLEQKLFQEIRDLLVKEIPKLQIASDIIANIDCLISFANISIKNNYTKPKISETIEHLKIEEGRHPVVEDLLKDDRFVSNDTYLNNTTDRTMVITGPNMAGKSTYMRQVAVITLMAHIGCFVPAKSAEMPIVDRVFTRVGASDDLSFGQSTFMVEMIEVAEILKNATNSSLIVLDEIGRGTSTYDGLSIAWAVVEYLSKNLKAKTLFATHYHELTELENFLDGVKNYKISVKELNNTIVFLRKIVRGGASRSFGIEVAKLAGVPEDVISRAKEISKNLEEANINKNIIIENTDDVDLSTKKDVSYTEIIGILKDIDINKMSPISAFETLYDLVQKANK